MLATKIIRFEIPGKPVTKKNSQSIVFVGKKCPVCHKGKRAIPIQSKAYLAYEKAAIEALKKQNIPKEPLKEIRMILITYFMPRNKDGSLPERCPDLTNLKSATDDILVRAGILADDNIRVIPAQLESVRWLEPEDEFEPYTEISIEYEGEVEVWSNGNLPF